MANQKSKPEPSVPTGQKKSYKVLKNLRHDGKGFAPGTTVELHDVHAAPLVKGKVVEAAAPATEAAK